MKLQPDKMDTLAVTGYDASSLWLNGQRHAHSVQITCKGEILDLGSMGFADLGQTQLQHWANLPAQGFELLILGTGTQQRFLPSAWLVELHQKGLGVECMNTPAACRTYNILAAEGRLVSAVLLLG